jgi:TRAP-type C4-dicarboxylate transport system substrate-binding protein
MKRTTTLMTGVATAALTVTTALPAFAAEKWDMPMAYSASNFHSENGVEFANCVTEGTAGEIEITVHSGGSLIAGADIKRAIQTGRVTRTKTRSSALTRSRSLRRPSRRLTNCGKPPNPRSKSCLQSKT